MRHISKWPLKQPSPAVLCCNSPHQSIIMGNSYSGDSDDENDLLSDFSALTFFNAIKSNDLVLVMQLVHNNSVNQKSKDVAVRMATSRGHSDILQFLLQSQASVERPSKQQWTALTLAQYYKQAECEKIIINSAVQVKNKANFIQSNDSLHINADNTAITMEDGAKSPVSAGTKRVAEDSAVAVRSKKVLSPTGNVLIASLDNESEESLQAPQPEIIFNKLVLYEPFNRPKPLRAKRKLTKQPKFRTSNNDPTSTKQMLHDIRETKTNFKEQENSLNLKQPQQPQLMQLQPTLKSCEELLPYELSTTPQITRSGSNNIKCSSTLGSNNSKPVLRPALAVKSNNSTATTPQITSQRRQSIVTVNKASAASPTATVSSLESVLARVRQRKEDLAKLKQQNGAINTSVFTSSLSGNSENIAPISF
jgi:hypothetical protein